VAECPSHPDEVSPGWLTDRLSEAGVIADASITALSWQPIGTGNVGDSVRFTLAYDRRGPWPSTIAGKFPASDETSRATASAFGVYAKEVNFYRDVAPRLSVRVPKAYAADIAPNGVDFILLFEDLGPARGGDQLVGCTVADARAAIRQAAALHAPSWNNAELIATEWLQPKPAALARRAELYCAAQAVFRERHADVLEPELMSVCEELNEVVAKSIACESHPRSLVHGDFRLDNMLFDIKGGAEEIAVLDWQTVAIGNGFADVGYFLGSGIGDRLRRDHETGLLDLYCSEMTRRGVPLTRAEIWDDYVVGGLRGIVNAVISAANVKRSKRGDACFLSMARGGCALALQHNSIARLKGADRWY
jgi:aminoglycoside/choline kinase family phosphotransferase